MSLKGTTGFYSQAQYARSHGKAAPKGGSSHWACQHSEPHWSEGRFDSPLDRRKWLRAHPFNPSAKHSRERLDVYATAILSVNGVGSDDGVLYNRHLIERGRREIFNAHGVPELNIIEGIYWRSHKSGRAVSTPEQRLGGASYYR